MSAPANVKGVLFDKDGTLFDFARTWEAWAKAFIGRVADSPEAERAIGAEIGFDTDTLTFTPDSIVIAGSPEEVALTLLPMLPKYSLTSLLTLLNQEAARAPQVEAVPLTAFLTRLRGAGFRVGVATNDAEAPARAHLGSAGVTDLLDFIAGYDTGFGAKPGPGQLLGFAEAMSLDPKACVMVGDSLHDLKAGRAAGFATAGVLTGYARAAELAPFADIVLPDIGHLPQWLGLPNEN